MRIPRFVCATGRTATARRFRLCNPGLFYDWFTDCIDEQWIQYRIISRCSADSPTTQARSEGATDNEPERAPGRGRQPGEAGIQPRLAGHTKFPGDHQAHSDSEISVQRPGKFSGHRTATRSSRGYADGVPRESAPLRLFQRHRWSCTHPTASAGSKLLERKSCHAAGIYDERGACESR